MAQDFCDAGLISVNGLKAKSSKEVKPGDEIEITRRLRRTKIRVTEIPASKQVAKSSTAGFYETVAETELEDDLI